MYVPKHASLPTHNEVLTLKNVSIYLNEEIMKEVHVCIFFTMI